jgi:hypothetical protein
VILANRKLEELARHAAIGIRFWDLARGSSVVNGLTVEVFPRHNPRARKPMLPNPSSVYVGHVLSGLADFASSDIDPPALWSAPEAALKAYRIEVRDRFDRFLPIAFDADLPVPGLLSWNAPWFSPPRPIMLPGTSGSPPQLMLERIPLFSTPSRGLPDASAVVYAELRDPLGGRPAAWALLGVSIEGERRGLGLADKEGRVAVMFPYPEPPRRALASPPEARSDFSWPVDLEVFWSLPSPPPAAPPEIADLAAVLAQLDAPGTVNDAFASPPTLRRLDYRVPLTARTQGAPAADASWLSVSAA